MMEALLARVEQEVSREFESDDLVNKRPLSPEEELEQRRLELRNGLTDLQRLFLFGKLTGLNDKDAAIAAGTPLAMLGAIGRSAQLGSIIKGGIYLLLGQFSSAVLLFLRYEFPVATRN